MDIIRETAINLASVLLLGCCGFSAVIAVFVGGSALWRAFKAWAQGGQL